jgi:hypothetical protein
MGTDAALNTRKRGRPFEKGNGGRKLGSRNRTTQMASALIEGKIAELTKTGLAMALERDPAMMKFFLTPWVPREPPIHLDLPPLRTAADAVEALAIIAQAVAKGEITPSQGAAVSSIADRFIRALDVSDISKQMAELQEKLKSDWAILKEQLMKGVGS